MPIDRAPFRVIASADLEDALDFDRKVERQRRNADGKAGMTSTLAQDFDQEPRKRR